ncbi:MAG: LPXTG cell wall anchor domain-containing protein [Microthrixaceae bacterium]
MGRCGSLGAQRTDFRARCGRPGRRVRRRHHRRADHHHRGTGGRQLEECPENAAGLALVSGELAPGGDIVVSGEGFAPDADLNLYVCSTPVLIGTAVADADGRVEGGGTIPTNLEAGVHYIIAYGLDSDGNPLTLGLEFGEESATTTTAPPSSPDDTAPATTAAIAVTPVTAATTGETAAVGGTAQAPATGALGNTGTSAGTVATIAAAVVLLGSALVLGARRRRQG